MASTDDYVALVTNEHHEQPNFIAVIRELTRGLVEAGNAIEGLIPAYDLDSAEGAQLDAIGLWVGLSRAVSIPITGVYFSLDTAGLGFDEGSFQGRFDTSTGISLLGDQFYRLMIRSKIGANRWNGTTPMLKQLLDEALTGTGITVGIIDNMNMTLDIILQGPTIPAELMSLLQGGYLKLKPAGVRITYHAPGGSIFGFDNQNLTISGFDSGAWV